MNQSIYLFSCRRLYNFTIKAKTLGGFVYLDKIVYIVFVAITSSNLSTSLVTYSLMGDNLDTNVKSRFIRTDGRKGSSLHYFHSLAIKDRISNLCELDITPYHICINKPESTALEFLPSISNDKGMRDIFIMIISRILATHMPYFNLSCSDIVTWHKHHKYYKEMSTKSEVVRLLSIIEHAIAYFIGPPWCVAVK